MLARGIEAHRLHHVRVERGAPADVDLRELHLATTQRRQPRLEAFVLHDRAHHPMPGQLHQRDHGRRAEARVRAPGEPGVRRDVVGVGARIGDRRDALGLAAAEPGAVQVALGRVVGRRR